MSTVTSRREATGSVAGRWFAVLTQAHDNTCTWPCHRVRGLGSGVGYTFQVRALKANVRAWEWTSPASAEFTTTTIARGASDPLANLPAEVTLSTSPTTVPEGTAVTVTATLSRSLSAAVTIPLTVTRGTSEDGNHGTLSAITITGGSLSGSETITTTSDADGDDETFTVAVTTANLPAGVSGGSPVLKTVTITDSPDTTAPTLAATDGITVNGATVTLTFNENLAAATGLCGSAFRVKKKGGSFLGEVLSSEPTVSGKTVTFTLDTAAVATDSFTLS